MFFPLHSKKLAGGFSLLALGLLGLSSFSLFSTAPQVHSQENFCEFPADIMLVMDTSGSMGFDDPERIDEAKAAASEFISLLGERDQSGLVSFASTATLKNSLSNNHTATNNNLLSLFPFGGTNIGDAIYIAVQELESSRARSSALPAVILLTDGEPTCPYYDSKKYSQCGYVQDKEDIDHVLSAAQAAADAGIKVFTIGLGSDTNESLLQEVVNITGASYHHATNGSFLGDIYEAVSHDLCRYGSISGCIYNDSNNDGDIQGEETVGEWEVALSGDAEKIITTDNSGCYSFTALEEGSYIVSEGANEGNVFVQTYPDVLTYNVILAQDEHVKNIDFGNYFPACGNYILDDQHGEVCEIGDMLSCTTGSGYSGVQTCSLACNIYESCETTQFCGDGLKNGAEQCDDGNNESGDGCSSACATEGIPEPEPEPEEPKGGEICGVKYQDNDGELETSADQSPLSGWKLTLSTATGTVSSATTDSAGKSCFTNLPPGEYSVAEESQLNWKELTQNPVSLILTGSTTQTAIFINSPLVPSSTTPPSDTPEDEPHDTPLPPQEPPIDNESGGGGGIILPGLAPYCGDGGLNGYEECDGDLGLKEGYICTEQCTLQPLGAGDASTQQNATTTDQTAHGEDQETPIILGEAGAPRLLITMETETPAGTDFVNPGTSGIVFTLIIINTGNLPSFDTIVTNTLPAGFSPSNLSPVALHRLFVAVANAAAPKQSITTDENGQTVIKWNVGNLEPSEEMKISYTISVDEDVKTGSYSNIAVVSAANHDPVETTTSIEVRAIEVLSASLPETGFSFAEFFALLSAAASLMILWFIARARTIHA